MEPQLWICPSRASRLLPYVNHGTPRSVVEMSNRCAQEQA